MLNIQRSKIHLILFHENVEVIYTIDLYIPNFFYFLQFTIRFEFFVLIIFI